MTMTYLRRSVDPQKQYRRWIDPRAGTLRRDDIITYLKRKGWKRLPPDRKCFLAFQEPGGALIDGRPLCQFVPDAADTDDYALRMFELLTGLAEYEDRQAAEVIGDIVGAAHRNGVAAIAENGKQDSPG